MNVKNEGKRIFGACLLLMMAVLTVYLVTFAAVSDQWDANGSYSLVVQKKFDFALNTPEEVKDQAESQSYTFRITGTRITGEGDSKRTVEVDETITLPRKDENGDMVWVSEEYKSNGPFDVTITEITDNIVIMDSDGNYYNMSESSSDTRVRVDRRRHELQLRNNSTLTLVRPKGDTGPEELWYYVTNRPYDEHLDSSLKNFSQIFSLKAGEEKEFKGLSAAIYTIEQIAAPDGYQLQLGEREEEVTAGEAGHFYINGTPGTLTLTAGGSKGDGITHYYTIDRTEKEEGDTSEFVVRTVPIASEESYKLDNLPKGGYTVTEFTIDASEASKVTIPETAERTMTGKSSGLTSETANSWKYFDLNYTDFDVDYIKMVSFGPLRNSSGNTLNSSTSYTIFRYGIANDDGNYVTNIKTYSRDTGFTGNLTVTMSDATKTKLNACKRLYCTATSVKSSTAQTIGVSWIEYDEKETEKTFKRVGESESLSVDDRKWIKIEAPALKDPNADGADQIAYYYTLKDKDGNLIQGITDREDTTVKLLPGDSTEMELPDAGSYTIVETIVGNTPVGFNMKVSGWPFGTTEVGKEIKVKVGGERDLTISKPGLGVYPEKPVDGREYAFSVRGSGFFETISVKAGESQKVTLPKEGEYTITPLNEKIGEYELGYTDSGAVYGPAKDSTSTVTFTNLFSPGQYGYRFVHEYYIREEDGTYTYVGNSQITTRLGRQEGEVYQALDISQAPQFKGNSYTHFSDAYGRVDGIQFPAETQLDLSDDFDKAEYIVYPIASVSSARANQGSDLDEANDQMYPIASESSAQAKLNNRDLEALNDQEPGSDDTGIINKGVGLNSEKQPLNYEPDSDWDHIDVTEDASQIVILRYYRDRQPKGKYNVIHVYYYRDENGDKWEGTTGVLPQDGELGIKYTGDGVDKIYSFQPADAQRPYTYTWDGRPQYGVVEEIGDTGSYNPDTDEFAGDGLIYRPNNDWIDVEGTKEGNQIIILRYYREPSKEGTYNIVHEYYFREAGENHDSETDDSQPGRSSRSVNGGTAADEGEEDIPYEFTGTINRNDGYVYTFEGRTEIESAVDLLGAIFTGADVEPKYSYGGMTYTYIDEGYGTTFDRESYSCNPSQQWAAVTKEGKDIIILRYYREDGEPEEPTTSAGTYNIVHEYYLKKSDSELVLEGVSDISTETVKPLTEQEYFAGKDMEKPEYGKYTYTHYENVYGKIVSAVNDGQNLKDIQTASGKTYGRDSAMRGVRATEEGDEIIILRYVRTEPTEPAAAVGAYNIVHEYYLKKSDSELVLEGVSDISTETVKPLTEQEYFAGKDMEKPEYGKYTYTHYENVYGKIISAVNDGQNLKDIQTASGKTYGRDSAMRGVRATEEGDEIIILRYVRSEPEEPDNPEEPAAAAGTYNIVHEYYLKKSDSELVLEGVSDISTKTVRPLTDQEYFAEKDMEKPEYGKYTYTHYENVYGKIISAVNDSQNLKDIQTASGKTYGRDSDMRGVQATEEGDEIIILRYVRSEPEEPDTSVTGSYKVVHMYYLRNNTGDHFEGRSRVETVERELSDDTYTSDNVKKITTYAAKGGVYVYNYDTAAYGHVIGDTTNDQPSVSDSGDGLYQADSEMAWVKATENGEQIIILKYYRRLNSSSGRPGSSSDSGTEPGPEPTEPAPDPEPETVPDSVSESPSEPAQELPDPNAPDSPDRVTIVEDGVPTTYVKVWNPETGEYMYLPEGEVPLWGLLPKTGDIGKSPLWELLAMSSMGILWVLWSRKPRKK